ncbi:AraC-like DNA-binding protein [Rheinheimera pacifica]|uniref:helix-turn-helix domain-containing protein n=1 Tax=Rheinheimera pacifica TaxID=173990 RepID=UPI002864FB4A|nr:helix-turn-helix domain-containing protein [Rheinheimera pacifica]MDR6982059.1 AraC-like DNA-binding protein [Rheinheimera pacifica]
MPITSDNALMTTQLLFFFSALGVFNALLLIGYLLSKAHRSLSDVLLACLLTMLSIRVGKSVFFYFSPDLAKIFLQLGLSACLLIGPFLYLYCLSVVRPARVHKYAWGHVLLPMSAIIVIGVLYPYQTHAALWGSILYKVVNYVWLLYLVLSLLQILPLLYQARTKALQNPFSLPVAHTLCLNVWLGCAVIWLAYFTGAYTSYISGALSFSLILYLSIMMAMLARRERQQNRYQDKKIPEDDAAAILARLTPLMTGEQLFLNPNLTLAQLAKRLGTNTSRLSQFINDNLNMSFTHYLNEKRIEYAKSLLLSDGSLSAEYVADVSGYNSLSTFYAAFKKFTGTTPAKFRQQASDNTSEA